MSVGKLFKKVYFKIWLGVCWLRSIGIPGASQKVNRLLRKLFSLTLIACGGLTLGFYVLSPKSNLDAIAATVPTMPSLDEQQDALGFLEKVESMSSDEGASSSPQNVSGNIREITLEEQFNTVRKAAKKHQRDIKADAAATRPATRPKDAEPVRSVTTTRAVESEEEEVVLATFADDAPAQEAAQPAPKASVQQAPGQKALDRITESKPVSARMLMADESRAKPLQVQPMEKPVPAKHNHDTPHTPKPEPVIQVAMAEKEKLPSVADKVKSSLAKKQDDSASKPAAKETAASHAVKHMDPTYVCPMHPTITSKDPNFKCPLCGMDLVLLENAGGDGGIVQLSPAVVNALGVKTSKVKRRTLYRRIETVGYISYDQDRLRTVSLRTDGWIEKLHKKSMGEKVHKGELLMEVYSPKLVNAQEEFVHAIELDNRNLVKASAERLLAFGVSKEQIKQLHQNRQVEKTIKIHAPQEGYISNLKVREGQFVPKSTPMVDLVNLNTVWLIADVFEYQAGWVKVGQKAKVQLPFVPDDKTKSKPGEGINQVSGVVDYVYPDIDPKSRSLRVRLRFDNARGYLRPNMYADVTIYAEPRRKVLTVPLQAVIHDGDERRVVVAQDNGHFKPTKVKIGLESNQYIEIREGVEEGAHVVQRAQFLIDSESSRRASLLRMAE